MGLIATGIVGLALMLLVVSGTFVHRPNLKKLSRQPRTEKARTFAGDIHMLVGSWTLPLTAILAMTGAFFSFAGAVLIPVVAMTAFDGDQEALIRTVIGRVDVADSTDVAELGPLAAWAESTTSPLWLQFTTRRQRPTSLGLDPSTRPIAAAFVRNDDETPD